MSSIGKNLVILRKAKGLTQEDLAKFLNLTRAAYSKYELESSEPTIERLIKLADFYNVSIDQLVGREFNQESETMKKILLKKQIELEIKEIIKDIINGIVMENEEKIKRVVFEKLELE